ncbi:MAG: nucleotidyl transferase AbiEii/AbiGii toxin family protein [bacterium]|nr:nucleotidyl transferase AbiEii/AbiGii toxin family protein [bacterium]MCY3951179.1 nucleotidyl transferase AbiEii/AbiGii toxin family protein [bacterium]
MGGTALAMQLRHRRSEDLDLFTPHAFDPDPLHAALEARGDFRLTRKSQGHLHGTFDGVKIDILWGADAATLRPPTLVAGIPVGSLQDIMATKLRAISSRHLLRDYFDVMSLEQLAGITVEEGFALYLQKYGLSVNHGSVHALVRGFGYFDDVMDDPILRGMVGEDVRDRVVGFFTARHPAIVRSVMQGPSSRT